MNHHLGQGTGFFEEISPPLAVQVVLEFFLGKTPQTEPGSLHQSLDQCRWNCSTLQHLCSNLDWHLQSLLELSSRGSCGCNFPPAEKWHRLALLIHQWAQGVFYPAGWFTLQFASGSGLGSSSGSSLLRDVFFQLATFHDAGGIEEWLGTSSEAVDYCELGFLVGGCPCEVSNKLLQLGSP